MKNALRSLMVGAFASCTLFACGGVQNDSAPLELVDAYDRLDEKLAGDSAIGTSSSELSVQRDDQIRNDGPCTDPSEVWAKLLKDAEGKICGESLGSIMTTPYDPKDERAPLRLALREGITLLLNVVLKGTAINEKSMVYAKELKIIQLIENDCKVGVPNNKVLQVVVMDYLKKYNLGQKNASGELFAQKCSYAKITKGNDIPVIR